MKEWQAFNDLKKKIDDFNETCPLLERMLDKSMMERHWKRIEEVTGWKFDVESEGFLLRHVMEAPLLQNMEDIEVSSQISHNIIIIWYAQIILAKNGMCKHTKKFNFNK